MLNNKIRNLSLELNLSIELIKKIIDYTLNRASMCGIIINDDDPVIINNIISMEIHTDIYYIFDTMYGIKEHMDIVDLGVDEPLLYSGLKMYAYYNAYMKCERNLTDEEMYEIERYISRYKNDFCNELLNSLGKGNLA